MYTSALALFRLSRLATLSATLAAAIVFLSATPTCVAGPIILATSYNTSSGDGPEGNPANFLAQEFTIFSSSFITSVDAPLAYVAPSFMLATDLIMEITTDSSNSPGAIIATDTGVTGTLSQRFAYSDINFAFASPNLAPGNYWLVLTDSLGQTFPLYTWEEQVHGTVNAPGASGIIDSQSIYQSNIHTTDVYMTQINGTVGAPTPEPATVLTTIAALGAIWGIRRRRRTQA